MAAPLPRRFYDVLTTFLYRFIFWLLLLIVAVFFEAGNKEFKQHPEHSYTFFLCSFPLYLIVMFGCWTLVSIGYHMIILGK